MKNLKEKFVKERYENVGRKKIEPTQVDASLIYIIAQQKFSDASVEKALNLAPNSVYARRRNGVIPQKHKKNLLNFLRNHIKNGNKLLEKLDGLWFS